ncbi:hypothetical protein CDV31_004773 [Fusarium ambrosium]|uniref:Rhodopsin domain-containing protein n=1 Tax=Fusarium ambrosium TaxID=131363 RepID=A0A428UND4_9HYPO|nr:hypothetical protein CDV31_004773 [Fusarium ambrosium]
MSSEAAKLIGVSSMLLALVTIFVTIRFFVRSVLLRSLDWDDALVLLSWCLLMVLLSTVIAMTKVGLGSYVDTVSADHLRQFLKLRIVISLAYVWGFVTVKMSFAVLYLRTETKKNVGETDKLTMAVCYSAIRNQTLRANAHSPTLATTPGLGWSDGNSMHKSNFKLLIEADE